MNNGILTQAAIPAVMPYGLLGSPQPVPLPDQVFTYDTDAADYIRRVQTADRQPLELPVRLAIAAFVRGCKADGIWPALKASCIMAGARTLSGALVPLVGTAPTNFNFVSDDYNRKTGLVGNGASKYIDSNRANNADSQNNSHASVYASSVNDGVVLPVYLGSYENAKGMRNLRGGSSSGELRVRMQSTLLQSVSGLNQPGFIGASRLTSSEYSIRGNAINRFITESSASSTESRLCLFAQYQSVNSTPGEYSSARLSFYSIGESLDLALLDARVTTLINAISAALS